MTTLHVYSVLLCAAVNDVILYKCINVSPLSVVFDKLFTVCLFISVPLASHTKSILLVMSLVVTLHFKYSDSPTDIGWTLRAVTFTEDSTTP